MLLQTKYIKESFVKLDFKTLCFLKDIIKEMKMQDRN